MTLLTFGSTLAYYIRGCVPVLFLLVAPRSSKNPPAHDPIHLLTCSRSLYAFGLPRALSSALSHFTEVGSQLGWLSRMVNATGALTDTCIALALCYLLRRGRTGFRRTDTVVNRLVVVTVNTGLVTGVFGALGFIFVSILVFYRGEGSGVEKEWRLFAGDGVPEQPHLRDDVCSHQSVYVFSFLSTPTLLHPSHKIRIVPVYTNSLLASLNRRHSTRSAFNTPAGTADGASHSRSYSTGATPTAIAFASMGAVGAGVGNGNGGPGGRRVSNFKTYALMFFFTYS